MLKLLYQYKFTIITTIIIASLSLMSSSEVPSTKLWNFKGTDKLVHLAMYSALSFILFYEKNRHKKVINTQPFTTVNILPIVIMIALGGVIELIQPALANRSREIMDFAANTAGTFLGFYLQIWFKPLLQR